MNPLSSDTIVLVEDDEGIRETLSAMLELHGFSVVTAADGFEGLATVRNKKPSLIITDVKMPGMTGFELLAILREDAVLRGIPARRF